MIFLNTLTLSGYNHPAIVKACEDPKMIVSLKLLLILNNVILNGSRQSIEYFGKQTCPRKLSTLGFC